MVARSRMPGCTTAASPQVVTAAQSPPDMGQAARWPWLQFAAGNRAAEAGPRHLPQELAVETVALQPEEGSRFRTARSC